MGKHFIRVGLRLYGIASILRIDETTVDPEDDPHPGVSPIPLSSVVIRFVDGSQETLSGGDADFFAKLYRPLAYTLADSGTDSFG